ncbi:hypothetical protein Tco_0852728, partial [Tanacetum coccineum]
CKKKTMAQVSIVKKVSIAVVVALVAATTVSAQEFAPAPAPGPMAGGAFSAQASDVKALTRKYKIPRDLHPVAVSSEWTMDRLHRKDVSSDPAPKNGFDEADVIALTHQPIDIRGIPSGLLFSAGLAITWEFPKFLPLLFVAMSSPKKTNSQQRVEDSEPKIVAIEDKESDAVPRGKAGAGEKMGVRRCRGDNLLEIPAYDSANTTTHLHEEHHDEHSGVLGNRDGNFDDDVDEEIDLEGPNRHVSDTTERIVIETESIPTAATRPDNGKSIS